MRFIGALILWIVIFVIAGAIFVWSGSYDVAADTQHWPLTKRLIGEVRENSIDRSARGISVPKLDDAAMVKAGAEDYAEMCTGCHLAPGMGDSEIRHGLNPRPPNLTRFAPDPAEAFWIIKHGLKMTGMPAWGPTHDDSKIWAMVAFLQKQPQMNARQFQQLTINAAEDHAHAMQAMPMTAGSSALPPSASSH